MKATGNHPSKCEICGQNLIQLASFQSTTPKATADEIRAHLFNLQNPANQLPPFSPAQSTLEQKSVLTLHFFVHFSVKPNKQVPKSSKENNCLDFCCYILYIEFFARPPLYFMTHQTPTIRPGRPSSKIIRNVYVVSTQFFSPY